MWWIISVLFFIGDCESTRIENANERFKRQGVSRSGRVGDFCSFNTDCLAGMFCSAGSCTCLSSFVAIEGYCYLKKNPGESDCNYDEQCSAIWPEAKCENGQCVCPDAVNGVPYVQAHTRDGFVCVLKAGEDGDPVPKCPLPEYDDDLLAMPVSQLRNPAMTSDEPITIGENIYPLQFCSSRSTDYKRFSKNGGGACVFSDNVEEGAEGIYIADIYDCVEVPMQDAKAVMSEIYNIHPLADGICCPNRAFTCIQPKREADVGLSSAAGIRPRWWYNAVTGACEQFMWDPWDETEMQSPNNFKTRQHCESYCHDTCKRGAPQYLAGSIMSEDERVGNCQTANSCMTNYECSNVGSMQLCCPTIASICSNAGGRPLVPYRLTNFDPGYTLKKTFEVNYAVSNRYYYDVQQGRCISFIYNGGLGNFNNFKTASECEFFCARLQCNYGAPLKIGANNQRCNSNSECPSTHECQTDHNVCCPRPQAICSQPLRPGDCKQSIRRYWYNAVARACEIFSYSGCQGNDNNFETLLDCQNTCENIIPEPQCPHGDAYKDYQGKYYVCSNSGSGNICPVNYECYYDGFVWGCCPTKTYTCTLSSNKGVTCGAGSSHRYYYNSQTQECESFLYNGCDGNPNNFATREECENYCGVGGCPNGGTPKHNELGRLIICSSSSSCPPTHECTSVNSGSSVVNRCCPTRAYICSLPPQQESSCSSSATSRFYFNIVTKECTQFTYNGCSGNLNNFATLEQCNNFCLSAACAPGDVAYVNPNTRLPYECNAGISNSCPNSFMCTYDQLSERSVCCGASNMDVCPEGEKAYVNAVDMSVRECLINVDNSCPSNYLCRFNAQRSRYYCCASISGDLCPAGKALYKESSTKNPVRCIIKNNRNQCPSGFSCQSNLPGAFQGYCCSSNYLCPNKVDFYIEESTQMPRSCTPGVFITCPSGYSCQSTQNEFSIGYCCKGGAEPVSDGCPPNEYVYVKDSDIVMCDPFNSNDASCPTGYSCQWSLANQQYQCCGSTPVVFEKTIKKASLGCPSNQVAYKNSGSATPRTCTAAAQDCPIGYFCQFSSINSQFQCCGISGGCPNDQVAFIGINGEPELCNIGQSNCPEGYSCQRLHSGNQICCTDDASACRESQVKDGGTCVNKSPIGGNCKKEAQCPNGSICANSICSCPPGMTNVDGKCRQGCLSTQILVEDKCLNLVDPGEFCEIDAQCQGKSTCKAGICECQTGQRIVNSKCVGISSKLANECPIAGQVPYIEPETTRVRFCSPSKNTCPKGFNCQRSRTSQLNVCCGRPLVGSPDLQNSTDICDKGTAYLIDGVPQECTRIRCPSAYECKFSAKARNYYCCSKVLDDGCPIGSKALLFPSTGTPVQCSNMRTSSCPSGYECVRSIRSGVDQCCSVVQRTQIFHQNVAKNNKQIKSPCPSYQVQVKRFFNGQYITRCESSCPMKQIAINGICQNVQPAD